MMETQSQAHVERPSSHLAMVVTSWCVFTPICVITAYVLLKILPRFEETFRYFGDGKLPALTDGMRLLSQFLIVNWFAVFLVLVVALVVIGNRQYRGQLWPSVILLAAAGLLLSVCVLSYVAVSIPIIEMQKKLAR